VGFRLTPQDTSFFTLFTAQAQLLVDATRELTRFLEVGLSERQAVADRLKELEHAADDATHELISRVNSSFITPFDREDIHFLASRLDDCMDHMEEAVDMADLYKVSDFPKGVAKQIEIIGRMADLTAAAMPRLRSMKDLSEYWIEINRLENQADQIYRGLLAALFNGEYGTDAITVMKLKEVIEELEAAADAFEAVAHKVESIAVKES
jgi:uncharacterized protein